MECPSSVFIDLIVNSRKLYLKFCDPFLRNLEYSSHSRCGLHSILLQFLRNQPLQHHVNSTNFWPNPIKIPNKENIIDHKSLGTSQWINKYQPLWYLLTQQYQSTIIFSGFLRLPTVSFLFCAAVLTKRPPYLEELKQFFFYGWDWLPVSFTS